VPSFFLFHQHKINGVQTFRNLRNLIWCQNYLREYFISGFKMIIKETVSFSYSGFRHVVQKPDVKKHAMIVVSCCINFKNDLFHLFAVCLGL